MTIAAGADILAADITALVTRITALETRHGVKLHTASQAVVSSTPTNIAWATEDEDTDAYHVAASATVTIPAGLGGIYAITYGVLVTNLSASTRQMGSIVVTSAVSGGHLDIYRDRTDVLDERLVVSVTLPLLAADSFTCDMFHTEGANRNATAHLSCYRVGP